jgi:hypothetical protein
MYYSPDRGASWTKTSTNLGASVTALAVDPNNSNVVYMSVTGSKHMMVSRDAGLNFIKPDTNLPPLNYSSVATSGDFVFVGNDVGVLYSPDTGITWFPLSAGYALPSALIMKLKVRGNYLIATTYGRGMYYIDVSHLPKDGNGVAAGFAPSSASISSIYPNPVVGTSTKATVTFSVMEDARTTIGVYDVLGREEKALFNQWAGKGEHSTTVDLSNIPAGQHYIMLTAAGTSITKPITVE